MMVLVASSTMRAFKLFVCLASIPAASARKTPRTLIVGIDGAAGSVVEKIAEDTQNYKTSIFRRDAATAFKSETLAEGPTWSGVGWSSILTGVTPAKHNVKAQDVDPANFWSVLGYNIQQFVHNKFVTYPMLFDRVETDTRTKSVVHWSQLDGPVNATYKMILDTDEAVKDQAIKDLKDESEPQVSIFFYHFDEVDEVAHDENAANGFRSSAYISKLSTIDGYVQQMVETIESRANFAQENWLVILVSDHGVTESGGVITAHGGSTAEERNAFYMVFPLPQSDCITIGEIDAADSPAIQDVAVTALCHHFGKSDFDTKNSEWGLDGKCRLTQDCPAKPTTTTTTESDETVNDAVTSGANVLVTVGMLLLGVRGI